MKITQKQFEEYMDKNWDQHFYMALVEAIKENLFPNAEASKEYREELKQLIWEAVSHGVKSYLEDYNGEAVKIITKEFLEGFSERDISLHIK